MTYDELMWDIQTTFGGETMARTYFTESDINNAIAIAMTTVSNAVARDLVALQTLQKDTVAYDEAAKYYPLPGTLLRLVDAYNGADKVHLVRPSLLFQMSQREMPIEQAYAAQAGTRLFYYGPTDPPAELTIVYLAKPSTIDDFPEYLHNAISAYAAWVLAKKARGLWNGNPKDLFDRFKLAIEMASTEYSSHPFGLKDQMLPSGYEIDDAV